jgi:hypothetical protein
MNSHQHQTERHMGSSKIQEAIKELRHERLEGPPSTSVTCVMRYLGQNWELDAPMDVAGMEVAEMARRFDDTHRTMSGFDIPEHQREVGHSGGGGWPPHRSCRRPRPQTPTVGEWAIGPEPDGYPFDME